MEINVGDVKSFIDTLWVIDCAILVFIMQAGFMCVESGLSRHKNSINAVSYTHLTLPTTPYV